MPEITTNPDLAKNHAWMATLRDINANFSDWHHVNIEGARLSGANLQNANLQGQDLSGLNCHGLNLREIVERALNEKQVAESLSLKTRAHSCEFIETSDPDVPKEDRVNLCIEDLDSNDLMQLVLEIESVFLNKDQALQLATLIHANFLHGQA